MIRHLKAALCVAAITCAPAAHAASFYQFDFSTSGYGQMISGFNTGQELTSTGLNNITISTRVSGDRPLLDFGDGSFGFSGSFFLIRLSANGIGFSDASPIGRIADETRRAIACFDNAGVSATPSVGYFAADSACSSATIRLNDNTFSQSDYSGLVTGVTVSLREGEIGDITTITNGVPEPSTWALMLAGFGMVGYSLRRKRATLAIA